MHTLKYSYSTSRGRDTMGYPIVRLTDETGRAFRCMGGGYDLCGTVFGNWLEVTYQDRLRGLDFSQKDRWGNQEPYGSHVREDGSVYLDGACGFDSMIRIAELIGLKVRKSYGRSHDLTTVIVTEAGEER